ncbi:cytochrome c3 family protein [Helicobacter cynogastricus]|uniref:cytochrome c3 family protein n=1 Tax=Helicobacter cynogastricus TaxID=329937 RepID=UPI000CF09AB7|nr:cytochrome c3 family protein [Helicobacter cynogastricus]
MRIHALLALVATGFLQAQNLLYSPEVLSLYLHPEDSKVAGRLLPTNAFSVVKTQGSRVLVRIEGYSNPKAPSVIYANDHQRVLVAAFAKNTPLKFTSHTPSKEGKWDRVSIEVWTDKAKFSSDLQAMLIHAQELFSSNCSTCHALHKPQEFRANAWPSIFRSMQERTAIPKKDRWLVIQYLQKNAQDSKSH